MASPSLSPFGRPRRRRPVLVVGDEGEDELRRVPVALRRAIDELLHRGLELGDADRLAVFRRLDLFAELFRHERAQTARRLRPPARIAGLAGAKSGGERRPAIANFPLSGGGRGRGEGALAAHCAPPAFSPFAQRPSLSPAPLVGAGWGGGSR